MNETANNNNGLLGGLIRTMFQEQLAEEVVVDSTASFRSPRGSAGTSRRRRRSAPAINLSPLQQNKSLEGVYAHFGSLSASNLDYSPGPGTAGGSLLGTAILESPNQWTADEIQQKMELLKRCPELWSDYKKKLSEEEHPNNPDTVRTVFLQFIEDHSEEFAAQTATEQQQQQQQQRRRRGRQQENSTGGDDGSVMRASSLFQGLNSALAGLPLTQLAEEDASRYVVRKTVPLSQQQPPPPPPPPPPPTPMSMPQNRNFMEGRGKKRDDDDGEEEEEQADYEHLTPAQLQRKMIAVMKQPELWLALKEQLAESGQPTGATAIRTTFVQFLKLHGREIDMNVMNSRSNNRNRHQVQQQQQEERRQLQFQQQFTESQTNLLNSQDMFSPNDTTSQEEAGGIAFMDDLTVSESTTDADGLHDGHIQNPSLERKLEVLKQHPQLYATYQEELETLDDNVDVITEQFLERHASTLREFEIAQRRQQQRRTQGSNASKKQQGTHNDNESSTSKNRPIMAMQQVVNDLALERSPLQSSTRSLFGSNFENDNNNNVSRRNLMADQKDDTWSSRSIRNVRSAVDGLASERSPLPATTRTTATIARKSKQPHRRGTKANPSRSSATTTTSTTRHNKDDESRSNRSVSNSVRRAVDGLAVERSPVPTNRSRRPNRKIHTRQDQKRQDQQSSPPTSSSTSSAYLPSPFAAIISWKPDLLSDLAEEKVVEGKSSSISPKLRSAERRLLQHRSPTGRKTFPVTSSSSLHPRPQTVGGWNGGAEGPGQGPGQQQQQRRVSLSYAPEQTDLLSKSFREQLRVATYKLTVDLQSEVTEYSNSSSVRDGRHLTTEDLLMMEGDHSNSSAGGDDQPYLYQQRRHQRHQQYHHRPSLPTRLPFFSSSSFRFDTQQDANNSDNEEYDISVTNSAIVTNSHNSVTASRGFDDIDEDDEILEQASNIATRRRMSLKTTTSTTTTSGGISNHLKQVDDSDDDDNDEKDKKSPLVSTSSGNTENDVEGEFIDPLQASKNDPFMMVSNHGDEAEVVEEEEE